jgi:hypothetical protein
MERVATGFHNAFEIPVGAVGCARHIMVETKPAEIIDRITIPPPEFLRIIAAVLYG